MPQTLTARVTPDGAASFEAVITNLTPSSLFLRARSDLRFRQSVTMELGALTLYGEVAFVCHAPAGVVVVFRASADDLHTLEDHMDEVPVLEAGEAWSQLTDDEEPTNPAGGVLSPAEVRSAVPLVDRRPPNAVTLVDRALADVLPAAPISADPADVPTVDGPSPEGETLSDMAASAHEDVTDHGRQPQIISMTPSVPTPDGDG